MNAKQLKFLQLFDEMSKADVVSDEKALMKSIKSFMALDYGLAADVWEYLATVNETDLSNDQAKAVLVGDKLFGLFYERAQTKCVKVLCDAPAVRRAVFQYTPGAGSGNAFNVLADLLSSNKTADAEEVFKVLVKNPYIHFGKTMKALLERLFIEILKKNPAKKVEMSKKLSSLLLVYISKIRTDERAMLEQRIREIL